jgi:membrane protein implicated in regulation of membrane protease activity
VSQITPDREVTSVFEVHSPQRFDILPAFTMWLVYLLALIFGGGLMFFQVVSGGHESVSADHVPDVHHGAGPGVLSIRSAIYGLFAFGFVGAALHILGLTGRFSAFALAVVSGLAAALAAGYTFATLGSAEASGAASLHEARGRRARVLLPCAPDRPGKIRLDLGGQQVDMKATCDGPPIAAGAEVVVIEVLDDVARVAAAGTGGAT